MSLLTAQAVWTAAALLVLAVLYSALSSPQLKRHGTPLKRPPNTLPLLGNGILFLQARQKLFSWFVKCERQFGYETFQIAVPTLPPGVVINDPRNLDFIYRHEGVDGAFSKGEFVKGMLRDLFGHGIITADGELWRVQRKAGMAFLNTANLRVLTDVALPQYLARSLAFLRSSAGDVVDLQVVFHEITSQLMGKMAYNMEMHSDDEFTMAFDYASGATTERFQNPLWPVTDLFLGSRLRRAIAVVKAVGKQIVAKAVADRDLHRAAAGRGAKARVHAPAPALADLNKEDKLDEVSGTLIQSLLESLDDEDTVADAALNYLSAGRDTVAQALTWTFYELMRHGDVVAKIRQEVQQLLEDREVDGEDDSDEWDGGGKGNSEERRQGDRKKPLNPTLFTPACMPYTMAVFYESLRLYPPIPFEIKQCAQPVTLPDGTFLPQHTVVVWCAWAMNRSRITWGEDAAEFRPERWLASPSASGSTPSPGPDGSGGGPSGTGGRLVSRSPSEFPVFNGGARTCIGKKMAEAVAVQVIAAAVWAFDFLPADGEEGKERVSKTSLTLPMEGGLPCRVRARSAVASG